MHNLSIVFQSPADVISPALYRGLQRTQDTFPDAEIIVSTWHRTPVEDRLLQIRLQSMQIRLILSVDPGPLIGTDTSGRWTINLNRLLCSTRAGLAAASHPLVIKLRTDTWLSSRAMLRWATQSGRFLRPAHLRPPAQPASAHPRLRHPRRAQREARRLERHLL
ncbi:hypothetical protein L9H89_004580 [Klebsiella aerogenes]|nr:hypothetical protein [Klebsiella aerogenes]